MRDILSLALRAYVTIFPAGVIWHRPRGAGGPDGNLWFIENTAGKIASIDPNTGLVTEFPVYAVAGSDFITPGPDGNLWFNEYNHNKVGRITTDGQVTEFPIPTSSAGPGAITAGPDGNVWFTEVDKSQIAYIDPNTYAVTEFPTYSLYSRPWGLTVGPDDNLWFTDGLPRKIRAKSAGTCLTVDRPFPRAMRPTGRPPWSLRLFPPRRQSPELVVRTRGWRLFPFGRQPIRVSAA